MPSANESTRSDSSRKSGAHTRKQAATWLTPEQIEVICDACLIDAFPHSLQGHTETIITLLADTGLRVSDLIERDFRRGSGTHLETRGSDTDFSIPLDD